MHPRRRGDGLVTAPLTAPLTHAAIAGLDLGARVAARDEACVEAAPELAILTTATDEPRDWIVAGMALEHVLLRAAADGVHAAYLNQPVQCSWLRLRLAGLLERPSPQVVVRLGYPLRGPELAPRRPVADIIV
jgi:hypothetical protein